MSNAQNNRLLDVLKKLLTHHVQREKTYQASLPQTDDAYWELDKQAREEFLAKQSPIDWETTPWQRAISFLSDVFSIVPKHDLRVHIAASKIGLDKIDEISVELVRLDKEGTTDKLLSVIQDEFPGEWIDLKLPVPSNLEHYKTSTADTASGIAPQLLRSLIKHVEKLVTTPDNDVSAVVLEGQETAEANTPKNKVWKKMKENEAIALLLDPEFGPNVSKIATAVGVPRTTLTGWHRFDAALKRLKEKPGKVKSEIPRGSKSADGTVEAIDESDESDE